MGRHYTPRGVLRSVPGELWQRYFGHLGITADVDWATVDDDSEPLYRAWLTLAPAERDRCEGHWRQFHELGSKAGLQVLIEEARLEGVEEPSADLKYGPMAYAVWCFLEAPSAFDRACLFQHVESTADRYWHRTPGMGPCEPDTSESTLKALARAISQHLQDNEGRGNRCTIEHYRRRESEHYFFCYPDDYTVTEAGHNAEGRLARVAVRRAFEVIAFLDAATGELQVYAELPRDTREDLTGIFAWKVLRSAVPEVNGHQPPYELDGLFDPDFPLAFEPTSVIRSVEVRRLRVSWEREDRRVICESKPKATAQDLRTFLAEILPATKYPRPNLHITEATFAITYRPSRRPRDKTFSFKVSYPNACSLKSKPDDQRTLGEDCLRRWGIARD